MTPGRVGREPRPVGPQRTCVGCRRIRPRSELIRVIRMPTGSVEVDPGRTHAGRGAYVCPQSPCIDESVRRGRFSHAFRAPSVAMPTAVEDLRRLLGSEISRSTVRFTSPEGRG